MFNKFFAAMVAVAGLAGYAAAHDPACCCQPHYRTVVCYETRCVPKTVCVTHYDHCGRPYTVEKTVHTKVVVAVTKRVRVS